MKTRIIQAVSALVLGLAVGMLFVFTIGTIAGCSQQQIQQGLRNVSAADCSTGATQQAFINNLPGNLFVTPAQELAILGQLCYADFGSVPAPSTAPGNSPMIPAVPAIVPSAVPTPVA